ncbi:hypothetical protein [Kurthia sp. Dielmo]|uniref:hypothetical protein n=1 Tax=Kurthia sp. Dielmo TaxID=1033738 RepID=UPI00111D4E2B|nr:hypothetical protein [Kurthia sp. Dielmo]
MSRSTRFKQQVTDLWYTFLSNRQLTKAQKYMTEDTIYKSATHFYRAMDLQSKTSNHLSQKDRNTATALNVLLARKQH